MIIEDTEYSVASGYIDLTSYIEGQNYKFITKLGGMNSIFLDKNVFSQYEDAINDLEMRTPNMKVAVYSDLLNDLHSYASSTFLEYHAINLAPNDVDKNKLAFNVLIASLNSSDENVIIDIEKLTDKPTVILDFNCANKFIFWSKNIDCDAISSNFDSIKISTSKTLPFGNNDVNTMQNLELLERDFDHVESLIFNIDKSVNPLILFDVSIDDCPHTDEILHCDHIVAEANGLHLDLQQLEVLL
jgi:hypothetical protein